MARILEFGDGSGVPALYFHGTPSSASEARWLDRTAQAHRVRLVAFDRRGTSGALTAGAEEGIAIADSLGIDRFATVGFSGGAGYALAAAHLAPDRVTVANVAGCIGADDVGSLSRGRRLAFGAAAHTPWLLRPLLSGALRMNLRGLDDRLSDPRAAARWFFAGPARGAQVGAIEEYVEATDPGDLARDLRDMQGALDHIDVIVADLAAYARGWGFALSSLATSVEIWHGADDPAAPVVSARALAAALPNAALHVFGGEGHFVLHSHGGEVLESIRKHSE